MRELLYLFLHLFKFMLLMLSMESESEAGISDSGAHGLEYTDLRSSRSNLSRGVLLPLLPKDVTSEIDELSDDDLSMLAGGLELYAKDLDTLDRTAQEPDSREIRKETRRLILNCLETTYFHLYALFSFLKLDDWRRKASVEACREAVGLVYLRVKNRITEKTNQLRREKGEQIRARIRTVRESVSARQLISFMLPDSVSAEIYRLNALQLRVLRNLIGNLAAKITDLRNNQNFDGKVPRCDIGALISSELEAKLRAHLLESAISGTVADLESSTLLGVGLGREKISALRIYLTLTDEEKADPQNTIVIVSARVQQLMLCIGDPGKTDRRRF